ncbi:biotin/lipoyl-binding protein [Halomonas sp. I1]|uniref:biotin/lipoyl-binding protein n=1 Tax=Halomonas sp. I1 TaxID=393536 RepID=UPI0028DDD241|nr:biotin/lipoyl-binding protein [Halomonas sp. I1]MDT8895259.1 biotin/lipoyl-binding protein [Halomonas sp. I1]
MQWQTAQVSGQLTELHVDVGDSVEAGQLLAELEALRTQLEQRRAGCHDAFRPNRLASR